MDSSASLEPPVDRRSLRRFLHHPSEFPWARLVVCTLFGAVSGSIVFLSFAHHLPLTFDLKVKTGIVFVALCTVGGALSSLIRCFILLIFTSLLGSRGRDYVMLLVFSVISKGPLSNIQQNAERAALSLSCNLDLQVHNSKLLWKHAINPFKSITDQLMHDQTEFQSNTQDVDKKFNTIRDDMVRQFGYEDLKPNMDDENSTQDTYIKKTLWQCSVIVQGGMTRCGQWFEDKWAECMKAIPLPFIGFILCAPMKFVFLCEVMRAMTPWCEKNIPVEGNMGMLYNQLNNSMSQLTNEFKAEVFVEEEEEQDVVNGTSFDQEYTKAVKMSMLTLSQTMGQAFGILDFLRSFTFIFTFIQAFGYIRNYRADLCFDNVYLTYDIRRLDAVRKRAGKGFLLPLKKSEKNKYIDPRSLKIHSMELNQVTSGLFQVFTITIFSALMLLIDLSFFEILDIIGRHTFTQFNVTSSSHVDIHVEGDTMMGRLIRSSISAFNSSSNLQINTSNLECMVHPNPISSSIYFECLGCVLLAALMSWIQVYFYRLRRYIAAFFNPEREKKRALYLYKLQMSRRHQRNFKPNKDKEETVVQKLKRCLLCK